MPGRPLTSIVWIDERAKAVIEGETVKRPRVETGGALFGFGSDYELVIVCAYGPGPRAKHRRTTFEPHPRTTDALIRAVWKASDRRYRYLGSWHSHPGGVARPSGTDVQTTECVANDPAVRLSRPLVLILATQLNGGHRSTHGELRAWHWSAEQAWLMPCQLEPTWLDERLCPTVTIPGGRLHRSQDLRPDFD
ncbi:MAG: M67 family metallopeptidase [Solirubrobacteraceae bacterium]